MAVGRLVVISGLSVVCGNKTKAPRLVVKLSLTRNVKFYTAEGAMKRFLAIVGALFAKRLKRKHEGYGDVLH